MALDRGTKRDITVKYRLHVRDNGSADVQIAVLTAEIECLSEHCKAHGHDHESRGHMVELVGRRRRLLDYLARTDRERHERLVVRLNIRK